jgi:SPP1 gp7 family putative phage head morphogenesis protein
MTSSEVRIKSVVDDILNEVGDIIRPEAFSAAITAAITSYYQNGVDEIEVQFGMNFFPDPNQIKFITRFAFENVKGLNDYAKEKLRQELALGLMNAETPRELAKRIDDVIEVSKDRARMIARTESVRAYNLGREYAAKESGLKLVKEWDAHLDDRTSKVCQALHGTRVGIKDSFTYKGEKYNTPPAHVNCRSKLLYIQIDE